MIFLSVLKKTYFKIISDRHLLFAITIAFIFGVIFSVIALHRYWQYEAWYYDFGIFAQAIYSVSRFEPPIIDHYVVTNKSIFADHFHPFIFVLSPLFWFTSKPEILLVAQSVFTAISGIFMFLTARKVTKSDFLSQCLLLIYFSFIGLHFAVITEFHDIALLPLPLAVYFYAVVTKKPKLLIASTILVLLVKESTFIIPAFYSLLEGIKSKGNWRKINVALLIFSLLYGISVIKIVIPYFSGGTYQYATEGALNFSTLRSLYDSPLKIKTMWQTMASYSFLPLLSPELLPPIILNWFTRFSLNSVSRHGLIMHYNAEVAPTLLFAAMYGVVRLKRWVKKEIVVKIVVSIATLWCIFYSVIVLDSPIRLAVIPDFYSHTKTFAFLDTLVETVPKDGSVMAQANLTPRFITRHVKMLRNNYEDFSPTWIVIDTRAGQNPNNFFGVEKPEELFKTLSGDSKYEVYYQQGEQFIYKRVDHKK
jgi:uncharacterized membrane protein